MDTLYLTVRAPRFYPTICVVVEADAVRRAEGSIWMTVTQGHQEPPESLARGTFSKRFPRNLGQTLCNSHHRTRWTMGSNSSRETGDEGQRCRGGVRTRSTDDNGEPQAEMPGTRTREGGNRTM